MRQTIVGTNAIYPIPQLGALNLALVGEANGRFVDVEGADSDKGPPIDRLFTEATAPGLGQQPGFAQFGEGVRIRPSLANGHVRLDYLARFQQFAASSESRSAFRRWTIDLSHDFPIYRTVAPPLTRDANGPNDCAVSPGDARCPPVIPPAISRNYTGSFGFRLLASKSGVSAGDFVLFKNDGEEVTVESETPSIALFLSGAPIDEPLVHYGPFVMNTVDEINEAVSDFNSGRFGQLEG